MSMFCYQCEQTAQGTGCTAMGICGKTPETAALQDVMVYLVKGISSFASRARKLGVSDQQINDTTLEALFMTLTNVNFDAQEHIRYIRKLVGVRERAKQLYEQACASLGVKAEKLNGAAVCQIPDEQEQLLSFAGSIGVLAEIGHDGADIAGLKELVQYGIKGLSAYAHHASEFEYRDEDIIEFVHETLASLSEGQPTAEELLALALKAGEINLKAMQLLDRAHTETLGHPEPTEVTVGLLPGKCILVSGHDLKALLELLKQTEGTDLKIYTHGEMLPAHSYPEFKRFKHLAGNYGSAWQNQVEEFSQFPGAILVTTNCLKPPSGSYKDRLFTTGVMGYEGVQKLDRTDFSPLIRRALACEGVKEQGSLHKITIGFGRQAVLGVAGQVIDAVKAGAIKHFFLIGGCDGAEYARNYFTEVAEDVPDDCVILTLGCAKYRFNDHNFGTIAGLPRLLDIGQCNDAYSAIVIAGALADAFGCSVNELPLSLVISWLEQKAVAVLLTLLYLGITDIRLGPSLPAFVTPSVLKKLVERFDLKPVGKAEVDVKAMLA